MNDDIKYETVEEFLARGGVIKKFSESGKVVKAFQEITLPPMRFVGRRKARVTINRVKHHAPRGYAGMSWDKMIAR